jgi:hypothetical protein
LLQIAILIRRDVRRLTAFWFGRVLDPLEHAPMEPTSQRLVTLRVVSSVVTNRVSASQRQSAT